MYQAIVATLDPHLWFVLAMGLSLAMLWRRQPVRKRWLALLTASFFGLFIISTPVFAFFANGTLEWGFPPRDGRPDDTQAIVVLSGAVRPTAYKNPSWQLGWDTFDRCLRAADIYKQGAPCPVVVSGGAFINEAPEAATVMRDFLLAHGIPSQHIVTESTSLSTYQNAAEVTKLLRERGIQRVALVTTATHLRRSQLCFRAQGVTAVPVGATYRAQRLLISPFTFLPSTSSADDVKGVVHEWIGIAWYRYRGWL